MNNLVRRLKLFFLLLYYEFSKANDSIYSKDISVMILLLAPAFFLLGFYHLLAMILVGKLFEPIYMHVSIISLLILSFFCFRVYLTKTRTKQVEQELREYYIDNKKIIRRQLISMLVGSIFFGTSLTILSNLISNAF